MTSAGGGEDIRPWPLLHTHTQRPQWCRSKTDGPSFHTPKHETEKIAQNWQTKGVWQCLSYKMYMPESSDQMGK